MKRNVRHGLLWLLVIALLPVALLGFFTTLIKAALAAVVIAAFVTFVFLFNYLNRNSPHARMARPPAESAAKQDGKS